MTNLYPIGTILTTRRLSQASLYVELFGEISINSYWYAHNGNVRKWDNGFSKDADVWRITVIPEEQACLSPVPMVGDLWLLSKNLGDLMKPETFTGFPKKWGAYQIEKRTYPNGQRASLIEWDEVKLPNGE